MHKAQRGQKLSEIREVLTPLNFVTPPSFSVTLPSCKPDSKYKFESGTPTGATETPKGPPDGEQLASASENGIFLDNCSICQLFSYVSSASAKFWNSAFYIISSSTCKS